MFDSAIVGIVTEEVKKPENDLFFYRTDLKDKVSKSNVPPVWSSKVLKKKVKFEIYEIKVCSALADDEKANPRNQLQNEVQERIDSTGPGFGPGFDTHVKYYIDKFGDELQLKMWKQSQEMKRTKVLKIMERTEKIKEKMRRRNKNC